MVDQRRRQLRRAGHLRPGHLHRSRAQIGDRVERQLADRDRSRGRRRGARSLLQERAGGGG